MQCWPGFVLPAVADAILFILFQMQIFLYSTCHPHSSLELSCHTIYFFFLAGGKGDVSSFGCSGMVSD